MDIIKEKWEEILYTVKLEHELTDVSFDTWLKPLKVHSFEKNGSANMLYILIPAEQQPAFGYIKKKYALPLRVAIAEITGLDVRKPSQAPSLYLAMLLYLDLSRGEGELTF